MLRKRSLDPTFWLPRRSRGLLLGLIILVILAASGAALAIVRGQLTSGTITDCTDDAQLQTAVQAANSGTGYLDITFDCGTGTYDIALSRTLSVTTTNQLTIDGNNEHITLDGRRAERVFSVARTGNLILNDLTITHGWQHTSEDSGATAKGAGLENEGGTVTITNCTFANNSADEGSGLYNGGGTVNLSGDTFDANEGHDGSGLYNSVTGVMAILNTSFLNQTAESGGSGGGIYNDGTIEMSIGIFANNSSGLSGSGFQNNGTANITNSIFAEDVHAEIGAGLENNGTTTITNSVFVGNIAGTGGGIYNRGTAIIKNTTLTGNSATEGGGLYNSHGVVDITYSTFAYNAGLNGLDNGSSLFNSQGALAVGATIVAENSVGNSKDCSGTLTDLGYNIETGSDCDFSLSTDIHPNAANLRLASAVDHNEHWTLPLQDGSVAINAVPLDAEFTNNRSACTPTGTTDQRNVPRPQGSACDAGAFEYRAPTFQATQPLFMTATGAAGATVHYSSPVSLLPDNPHAASVVTCMPESLTTFPIGVTTVTCAAIDPLTIENITSVSFAVTVNAPDLDLHGADFVGRDFTNTSLRGANLSGADFSGDSLSGVVLSHANLSMATLTGADLTGANLQGTNLTKSVLYMVNFTNANLRGAKLQGSILTGAIWNNTICPDGTNTNSYSDFNLGCEGHFV